MKSPARLLTLIFGILIGMPALSHAQFQDLDLSANDIATLASVGVKPEYIKQIKSLGYDDISAHDIVALYSVGVKPKYIKQIKSLGYDDISAHDIVKFYTTGVSPEYIKQMKDSGMDVSPGKIQVHVPEIQIPEIRIPEIDVKIDKALAKQEKARIKRRHKAVTVTVNTGSKKDDGFSFLKSGLTMAFLLLLGGALYLLYLRNKRQPAPRPTTDIDTRISIFEKRVDDLQDILLSIDHRIDRRMRRI